MIDIYVLDDDLNQIGIIDNYTSLLWVNRYKDEGDCELYIEATNKNLSILKKGNYLSRLDDDMVCRIEKVELTTDAENGNYLIVTGYDVKKILGQRILWSQTNVDGNVEDYIRDMIYKTLVNPNLSARAITNGSGRQNFFLGDKANFTEVTTEQSTYKKVSEKVKEFCTTYGWGYKVIVDIGNFYFVLYKGEDKSESVIFADEFENLISTSYKEDSSNLANVALVAGEGEGSERARNVSGYAESLDRYEIFVDAKDISRTITFGDLIKMYPLASSGGQGYIDTVAGVVGYYMGYINIPIVDDNQLEWLRINYPDGTVITVSGQRYYQTYDALIADLKSTSPQSEDSVILRDIIYSIYLLNRGYEKLAEYGSVVSFEGSVEPNTTFKYKRDYFLGDEVTVRNKYGIEAKARIIEVMETCDDNGYVVEPKFEYLEGGITPVPPTTSAFLLTENGSSVLTENGTPLKIESAPMLMSLNSSEPSSGSLEIEGIKISELPESTDIYEGCCMPIVTYGETKKVTYRLLKERLAEDIDVESISDSEIDEICI